MLVLYDAWLVVPLCGQGKDPEPSKQLCLELLTGKRNPTTLFIGEVQALFRFAYCYNIFCSLRLN